MNFKFDKDTAIIIAVGCVLMAAWMLYLPKYQAKRAAEYQRMIEATQQNAAPAGATSAADTDEKSNAHAACASSFRLSA